MKIKGKALNLPKPMTCVFHREDGDITFHCGPVVDFTEFEQRVPEPKPPLTTRVDGRKEQLLDDPKYQLKLAKFGELRFAYLCIRSIGHTPDLEWSTVDISNPDTWGNYEKDLKSVLTTAEYNRLIGTVLEANNPSAKRRQEALENFTSTVENQQATNSPTQEQ